MIDQIIPRLKEEIAIDGATGTSIEAVWEYVEKILGDILQNTSIKQKTPVVDDKYKAFLWEHLKRTDGLEFYENLDERNRNAAEPSLPAIESAAPTLALERMPPTTTTAPTPMDIDDSIDSATNEATTPAKTKEKAPANKRKAPAKKKNAPARNKSTLKKKKKVVHGNSDDDFDPGSEEEDSEFDSEEEEEETDDAFDEEEDFEDDDDVKPKKTKTAKQSVAKNASHPMNVVPVKSSTRRSNIMPIKNIDSYSYEQIRTHFANGLQILASPKLQQEQLLYGIAPGETFSPNLIVILQEIIKTRSKGLYQASISKLLDLDGRSTGHYCKSLEAKGAIVRLPVAVSQMRTNVCIHTRFNRNQGNIDLRAEDDEVVPYNVNADGKAYSDKTMLEKLVLLTKDAPDKAILSEELLRACGFDLKEKRVRKWYNRILDTFELKGYIKKTNVRTPETSKFSRCLQLLKVPESMERLNAEPTTFDIEYPMKIRSTITADKNMTAMRLLSDKTVEDQIYQVIEASGEAGVTQKDIAVMLRIHEQRILYKTLERIVDDTPAKYSLGRVIEFEGRIKRFRYFTYPNYRKIVLGQQDGEPLPTLNPNALVDESICRELNIEEAAEHDSKHFTMYMQRIKTTPRWNQSILKILGYKTNKELKPLGRPRKDSALKLAPMKAQAPKKAPAPRKSKVTARKSEPTSADTAVAESTGATTPTSDAIMSPKPSSVHSILIDDSPAASPVAHGSDDNEEMQISIKAKAADDQPFTASTSSNKNVVSSVPTQTTKEAPIFSTRRRTRSATKTANVPSKGQQFTTSFQSRLPGVAAEPASSTHSVNDIDGEARGPSQESSTAAAKTAIAENTGASKRALDENVPSQQTASSSKRVRTSNPPRTIATRARTPRSFLPPEVLNAQNANLTEPTNDKPPPQPTASPKENLKRQRETNPIDSTAQPTTDTAESPATQATQPDVEKAIPSALTPDDNAPPSPPLRPTKKAKPTSKASKQTVAKGKNKISYYFRSTRARTENEEPMDDSQSKSSPEPSVVNSREITPASHSSLTSDTVNVLAEPSVVSDLQPSEPIAAAPITTTAISTTTTTVKAPSNFKSRVIVVNGIRKYNMTTRNVNLYLEKRVEVYQAILNEQPIIELSKNFRTTYIAKFKEIVPENMRNNHLIDMKTLKRTAQEVVSRGLAKLTEVEYRLISGKKMKKLLLVRNDIDLEGEEYSNHVKYMQELRVFHDTSYVGQRFEISTIDVEPLQDRLERMKNEVKHMINSGERNKATELKIQLDQFSKNLNTFKKIENWNTSSSWMIQAVQFGWINATMVRVKRLHLHILHLLENRMPGTNYEERTINLKSIVNYMTVEALCELIGVFTPTPKVKAFLQEPENIALLIKDLDTEMKVLLLSEQNKFRRRLRNLINLLLFCQILTPIRTDIHNPVVNNVSVKYIQLAEKYTLNDPTPVISFKRKGRPIINVHHIRNEDDLTTYYKELQYACTSASVNPPSAEEQEPPPTDAMEQVMFKTIHNSKNWSTRSVFKKQQRKILNAYIDKLRLTTPLNNAPLMRRIAADAELSYSDVEGYYIKVEAAFERKKSMKEMRSMVENSIPRRRKRRRGIYNPTALFSLNSTRAFRINRQRYPQIDEKDLLPVDGQIQDEISKDMNELNDSRSRGEFMYYDDMTALPVISSSNAVVLNRRRRARTAWTSNENELLIYAYIILRHRARRAVRFLWGPISELFPDRAIASCRNHFSKLMAFSYYAEMLQTYSGMWPVIYANGIRSGELVDDDPEDLLKIDLLEYVSYFIQKLARHNPDKVAESNLLPRKVKDLKTDFEVVRSHTEQAASHDVYHDRKTLLGKQKALYIEAATLKRYRDSSYDIPQLAAMQENDRMHRLSNMCRCIIFMILMTPEEVYDPFFCYALLKSFPEKLFKETLKIMNEEGTLLRRGKLRRRIPTTPMSLSESFVRHMMPQVPAEFFYEAKDYTQFLHRHGGKSRYRPEFVSSGMMASLLTCFSNNQLELSMVSKNSRMEEMKKTALQSRSIEMSSLTFQIDIESVKRPDETMTYIPPLPSNDWRVLSKEDWDSVFNEFLAHEEDFYLANLCEKLVNALSDAREEGLTGRQLYTRMLVDDASTGFHNEEDILTAIRKLIENDPPLICRVGFDSVRYIHALYIHEWTVITKNLPHQAYAQEVRAEIEAAGTITLPNVNPSTRKEVILPSLWTDVNGNRTDIVLKDCKELLLDLILRKPGITEADIHRHFRTALSRRDIADLLGMLTEQQLLRKVHVGKRTPSADERKPSIFNKRRTNCIKKKALMTDITQTCYWLKNDMFSNLS